MPSVYIFDILNILGFFESHITTSDYLGSIQGGLGLLARHWLLDRLEKIYYVQPEDPIYLHRLVYNGSTLDHIVDHEFDLHRTVGISHGDSYTARIEGTTLYVTRNATSGKFIGHLGGTTGYRTHASTTSASRPPFAGRGHTTPILSF